MVVIVEILFLVALLLSLLFFPLWFRLMGGLLRLLQMDFPGYSTYCAYFLWPASWFPAIHKEKGFKSVDIQKGWEVHDERLQFMSQQDALRLDESLNTGDVSRAWLVWSGATEAAIADAHRFCGVLFLAGFGPWSW